MVDTSTEAVTKLLDGVTPGPWAEHDAGKHPYVFVCGPEQLYYNGDVKDKPLIAYVTGFHAIQNRSFIAAARDLVPTLLAERDALRRENENLRQIERNVQAAYNRGVRDAADQFDDGTQLGDPKAAILALLTQDGRA